jgi:hypothetical protein
MSNNNNNNNNNYELKYLREHRADIGEPAAVYCVFCGDMVAWSIYQYKNKELSICDDCIKNLPGVSAT